MTRHRADPDVVSIYSRLAFIYDVWEWATERKSLELALVRAEVHDGEAVLEVAVGTGAVFCDVLRLNPSGRNVGVDLTEAMLRRARRRAGRAGVPFALEVGDARALAFDSGSFDVVLSNNMFGLLPRTDVEPVLREMLRVLRPGGRCVFTTMFPPKRRFSSWIYRVGAKWLGGWNEVDLEPVVRAVGFQDVHSETVSQMGIPSQVVRARKPPT